MISHVYSNLTVEHVLKYATNLSVIHLKVCHSSEKETLSAARTAAG